MRIALLQPCYWPEVRRGTERVVHDLGVQLNARGHDVTVITSHPSASTEEIEEGVCVLRLRRPPTPSPLRWYEEHLTSAPAMAWKLLRGNYDVANAFHPAYAWAAVQARRFGGPPVIFSMHGIPERKYLVQRRYRMEMLETVVAGSAACTVLSETAATVFRRHLRRDPVVLPAGYFATDFEIEAERAEEPTLVCGADLGDSRKRGAFMLEAFDSLRKRRGEVRLRLVSTPGSNAAAELSLPDGAEWVEGSDGKGIPRELATAWATVHAAVGEAQGLLMIESLATGTPVVAARSGAAPEIVSSDAIGRLFGPDDEAALVAAMDETLELVSRPETADACRRRAAEFEWGRLIEGHERLYASTLNG